MTAVAAAAVAPAAAAAGGGKEETFHKVLVEGQLERCLQVELGSA
jgi:hypothetical protein